MSKPKHHQSSQPEPKTQLTDNQPSDGQTEDETLNPLGDLQNEITELQRQLETAQAEAAEAKDTLLRKAADLENTKKRLQTEKEKSVKAANKGLLTDLLEVLDNFGRALSSVGDGETVSAVIDGVRLIENQLISLLANKYDVKAFDSVGEIFDPERHEAVALGEPSETDEQIVLTEYQKGYTWGDAVLRTAKVVVSAPSDKTEKTE